MVHFRPLKVVHFRPLRYAQFNPLEVVYYARFLQTRRNSKIVQLAKTQALINNNGKLKCECCSFDFLQFYGQVGSKFIECHHKIHIAAGQRVTKIDDLALLCSNCHRMLHRKLDNGEYHTTETLIELINKNKTKN